MAENNIIKQLENELSKTTTNKIVKKARKQIEKFNGETDAKVLSGGLEAIKEMLEVIHNTQLDKTDERAKKILEELRKRWVFLDNWAKKTRGKRPVPILTAADRNTIAKIRVLSVQVYGDADTLPVNNILPLLLEAAHE